MSNSPAPVQNQIAIASNGIELKTMQDALEMARYIVKSPFCPQSFKSEGDVLIALQCAMELGLAPLAGLQNIAVINGRPGIYGDAALALVRASGLLEYYKVEYIEGKTADDWGCKVTCARKGYEPASEIFTVGDAKKAGLWDKAGPWKQYPKRMLMFRARGFLLRDQFGDILKGFKTTEELEDIPPADRAEQAKRVTAEEIPEDPFPNETKAKPSEEEKGEPKQ